MRVRKRCGETQRVDLARIVHAINRHCEGLRGVDAHRIAATTIGSLVDGSTTRELDELSIRTAASLTYEEPAYSKLAARLLCASVHDDVAAQGV
ncbi:MAG: ribonucleoside-diphosphate reductase subunit alpha, partial [Nannocystaceae bacterium]|nr:ribonucleoside-diphosphate reductase subunit alpha [Nannocystaceae bacterium]